MSRTILIVALVAALIGGVATYTIQAATQTAESEVRISAQRFDNGRLEFALQQRQPDGAWGERLLPERRFFPASGALNRWTNSSPISITSQLADAPIYVNDTQPPARSTCRATSSSARTPQARAAAGSNCLAASKAARIWRRGD